MIAIDLKNRLTFAIGIPIASVTATANQTGIDLKGYIGNVLAVLHCGAATAGTNPTMNVTIEDSADNSTFAAVSGYAFTQVTTTASLQQLNVDTRLVRRYIRFVVTIGGTSSPAFPMSGHIAGIKQII